jgi:DNA polymerase-3 subunit beta
MSVMVEKSCLKVRGDAKELSEAIGIAASVAPAKSPRPVLQNLLLDAHDGVLEVTGTDLDVAIRVRIERVDVATEGRVLVNAARFQGILRELVGEQVEIETDERAGCIISTGDSRFHVMGEEPDDFPEIGAWKGDGAFQLRAAELVDMVRRTHFAAHPEKTRYAMNGILVDLKEKRLRLVATDGKRLSMCERPVEAVKSPVFVVVPTKAMQLLQRVVGSGEQHVEICVEPAQVHLRTATATVVARLIEGHFPPYEDVLPKNHDKKLVLPREGFLSALRRAALLATKDSQAVRFRFAREGLELTARVPEVGESRVQFPLDYPFDELTIGFNPAFFADVLKVLATTEFTLQLKDTRSAAVVQEQDKDGGVFVYLVMPLNLGA